MQYRLPIFSAALLLCLCLRTPEALGQSAQNYIAAPDRKHIFSADAPKTRRAREKARAAVLKVARPVDQDLDFKASDVQFSKDKNEIHGKGDVVISRDGLQVQAQEGKVNLTSKDSEIRGNVVVSGEQGDLKADAGRFNLDSETGDFDSVQFSLDNENYFFRAGRAQKVSELHYRLVDSAFTTCECEDDYVPWELRSSRAEITRDGYAHIYDNTLRMFGAPVFYLPWFAFPVKEERQSGLLIPEYSMSSEDGFGYRQPLFLVLNDSSDMTISPFVETRTRAGSGFDFRQVYSRRSRVSGRLIYSNESLRDGDLRGTVTDGIYDPEVDDNRLGGYFKQGWRSEPGASLPMSLYSDVRLISDNLFLREMQDDDIGERESRYTTSSTLFNIAPADWLSAELGAEYNQSLLTNQDFVFQRLPDVAVTASRSFRPFGYNSLGLKVVPSLKFRGTDFWREEGYDGQRYDISPGLRIPFHYMNYFASDLNLGFRGTAYQLDDRNDPGSSRILDDSQTRNLWNLEYRMGTAFERVFNLPENNLLTYLSGLGASNQKEKLVRVRHNIEPALRYYYVPPENQGDLPLFDSLDRISARNVMTYGVRSSLDGRFMPGEAESARLQELTPRLEDLPLLSSADAFLDPGEIPGRDGFFSMRRGSVSELAYVEVKQAYDFREASLNLDPSRGPVSDLGVDLGISPSRSFALRLETDYDTGGGGFSSWAVSNSFYDDRGDALRGRFNFVDNSISQVEANLEVAISSRLSAGYYGRWDEREREFIESRGALRLAGSKECWFFDLGVASKMNPDKKVVFLSFNFGGLGALTQNIGLSQAGN